MTDRSVSFRSFSGRPVWLMAWYRWGNEYDGRRQIFSLRNSITLSNNIYFYIGYSYTNLDLKYGQSKSNLLSGRLSYSFSPRFYAKYFIQWNDADRKLVGNFLIDYIFRPKSHIYLVYNENRDTTIYGINNIKDRAILAKFTYLFTL